MGFEGQKFDYNTPVSSHKTQEKLLPSHIPIDMSGKVPANYPQAANTALDKILLGYTESAISLWLVKRTGKTSLNALGAKNNAKQILSSYFAYSSANPYFAKMNSYLNGKSTTTDIQQGLLDYFSDVLVKKLNFGLKNYKDTAADDRSVNNARLTLLNIHSPTLSLDGVVTRSIYVKGMASEIIQNNLMRESLLTESSFIPTKHLPDYAQGLVFGLTENLEDNIEILRLLKDPLLMVNVIEGLSEAMPVLFNTLKKSLNKSLSALSKDEIYPFARFVGEILGYLMPSLPSMKLHLSKSTFAVPGLKTGINLSKDVIMKDVVKWDLDIMLKDKSKMKVIAGNIAQQLMVDAMNK
ncbi:MAG: hypothetical protein ACK4NC_02330 [Candidatus Gracilibacteria bacterium]